MLFCYCFPCLGRSGGHSVALVMFSLLQAGPHRSGGHSVVTVMFCVVLLLFSLPRQVWRSFCCFGDVSLLRAVPHKSGGLLLFR